MIQNLGELSETERQLIEAVRSLREAASLGTFATRAILALLIAPDELRLLASLVNSLQRLAEPPPPTTPAQYTGAGGEVAPVEL